MAVIKASDYTKISGNSGSANVDLNSMDKNNADQLEIKNYSNASTGTVLSKTSTGLTYLPIQADGNGNYTKVASKEYVSSVIQGSLQFQGTWTPLSNTPNITTVVVPSGSSFFWICDSDGQYTLNAQVYTFGKFDWIVKKSDGTYTQLNKSDTTILWKEITGNITENADLVNYVRRFTNIQSMTATGNATAWKSIIVVDCGLATGNVVITLPTSANVFSQEILVTRIDSVANNYSLVIQPFAGEQLDGSINNTITLSRNNQTASFIGNNTKVYSYVKPSSSNPLITKTISTTGNQTLSINTEYHISSVNSIGCIYNLPTTGNSGDIVKIVVGSLGLNNTQSKTFTITGNINNVLNQTVVCNSNNWVFDFVYDSTGTTWILRK